MTTAAARPWYREPWPWFLLAVPVLTVAAGVVTFVLAANGADGVVAADYYKRGLEIGIEARRQQQARTLDLRAQVAWDGLAAGDAVRLTLAGPAASMPPTLRLRLVHPSNSGGDRIALLTRASRADGGAGTYIGAWGPGASAIVPRTGQVIVETDVWRIDGTWHGAGAVALASAAPVSAVTDRGTP